MTSSKNTKRALLASVLSVALCCAMLVGSTFAWFTDIVTSGNNIVKSGNLKISATVHDLVWSGTEEELDVALGSGTDVGAHLFMPTSGFLPKDGVDAMGFSGAGTDFENNATFMSDSLFEPGKTYVKMIQVKNEGNLAAKVKLHFDVTDHGLQDALWFAIAVGENNGTEISHTPMTQLNDKLENVEFVVYPENDDPQNTPDYINILFAYGMNEEAGNEYKDKSFEATMNILATQYTYEEDAFDNQYDAEAEYPTVPDYSVDNIEALKEALENAVPGDLIEVAAGEYISDSGLTVKSGVTLLGANAGTSAAEWIADADEDSATIIKGTLASNEQVLALEEGATVDGVWVTNIGYKGIVADDVSDVVIRNTAVTDSNNDAIDLDNCTDAVVENCYIDGLVDCAIEFDGFTSNGDSKIVNNVVKNVTNSENGAIRVYNGTGDVLVEGNIISNVKSSTGNTSWSSILNAYSIVVDEVEQGGNITVRGNELDNVDYGISVYKYTAASSDAMFRIEENRISHYNEAGITVSTLHYNKNIPENIITSGMVTGNSITTESGEANPLDIQIENDWDETTTGWQVTCSQNESNGTLLADQTYSK